MFLQNSMVLVRIVHSWATYSNFHSMFEYSGMFYSLFLDSNSRQYQIEKNLIFNYNSYLSWSFSFFCMNLSIMAWNLNDNIHTQLVHLLACHSSFTNVIYHTQFCHFGMYIHQFIHQPFSLSWNHVLSTNFPSIQLWHHYHPYVISSFMESLQMVALNFGKTI